MLLPSCACGLVSRLLRLNGSPPTDLRVGLSLPLKRLYQGTLNTLTTQSLELSVLRTRGHLSIKLEGYTAGVIISHHTYFH